MAHQHTQPLTNLTNSRGTAEPRRTGDDRDILRPDFGSRLFAAIAGESADRNVVISPLSAFCLIAMCREGADGSTRDAIDRALDTDLQSEDGLSGSVFALYNRPPGAESVTVSIANSMWIQPDTPVAPEFVERLRDQHRATVTSSDLSTQETMERINTWVAQATHGKIGAILHEPLSDAIVFALVNAAYFKGRWEDEFEEESTSDRPFHFHDSTRAFVPMMARTGRYNYWRAPDYQAVRLPYGHGRYSMYVLLPDPGVALSSLYNELTAERWSTRRSGTWVEREVSLQLPRFTLRHEVDLETPLRALGMGIAFDEKLADFSRMFPQSYIAAGGDVFIGKALQKAFIDVNEKGTEAAAETSLMLTTGAMPLPPIRFIVDRPFLVMILDDSRTAALFLGQVVDPR